jgi:hypothetical protein
MNGPTVESVGIAGCFTATLLLAGAVIAAACPAAVKGYYYPHGKPFPIVLIEVAMGIVVLAMGNIRVGSRPFPRGSVCRGLCIPSSLERMNGLDVRRIPRRRGDLKFLGGTPAPMVALRYGFFVVVAMMIVFGLAPLADATQGGIIGCAIGHLAIGFLSVSFM